MPRPLHPIIAQLRATRQRFNQKQYALAFQAGFSESSIGNWETGVQQPNLAHLTAWAAALGYNLTLEPICPNTKPSADTSPEPKPMLNSCST